MSDRDTFGPRLRREREKRGISVDTIAAVTKVSAELWEGLERNDFSRWPSGIFARAFVRDYARAVGLDADEIVDEFCRLFPIGDRRGAEQRLAERRGFRFAPRAVAAAMDTVCALLLGAAGALLIGGGFWPITAVCSLLYHGFSTAGGSTPGTLAVDVLRQKLPTLFVQNRRAHA